MYSELTNNIQQLDESIVSRDADIVRLATKYRVSGYEMAPLERDQVITFKSTMIDMQKKQDAEFSNLQVCGHCVYFFLRVKECFSARG